MRSRSIPYALCALLVAAAPACVAASTPSEPAPYRYFAVIGGACERLVLAGRDQTAGCRHELVNVDFGNGRVAFAFTSPSDRGSVVTTFVGRASAQPDLRTYRLEVDELSTVTHGKDGSPKNVAEPVSGHCAMTGDPTREPARFECVAKRADGQTSATFVSAGAPTVYAGGRASGGGDGALVRSE
jgi:hypothetical protein